jgi:hypothetical protein
MRHRPDNVYGLAMCAELLISDDLAMNEREFVASIVRQIINHPIKFSLSAKQAAWLKAIYERNKVAVNA